MTFHRTTVCSSVVATALLLCAAQAGAAVPINSTTPLFLPSSGSPAQQGWLPLVQGTTGPESSTGSAWNINTMADQATVQGYGRISPVALDVMAGFVLTFNVRIDAASSSTNNRAGFSLLLVGSDPTKALELGFTNTEVFAYAYAAADPDRFVHGAGFGVSGQGSYTLTAAGGNYSLNVNGQQAFAGSFVNYTAQGQPYTVPNFVFFGDDTSRAASNSYFGPLVLTTPVPEPATAWLLLAGVALAAVRLREQRPPATATATANATAA